MSFIKTKNTSSSRISKTQREILERDFWEALKNGILIKVKECITKGVDKNIKCFPERTALHCASQHGHLEIVKYFIETCRVDPEAKDSTGWTALHWASQNGHLEIVKYFIETCQVDPEVKSNFGSTALHYAIQNGHLEIVKYFIETCQVDPEAKDNTGWTALYSAIRNGHLEIVKYFIETCRVDPEAEDSTGKGWTALHRACFSGHLEIVKYFIETCRVDPEAKDSDGWTALHFASYNGHLEIVKYFIETCRVDPEAKDSDGSTALHYASQHGHLEIVKYFIETCQVDPEVKSNDGITALHRACYSGHLEIVKYFIETCQVEIDAKTKEGQTPNDLALMYKRSYVNEYLIQVQVDTAAAIDKGNKLASEKCTALRNAATSSSDLLGLFENTSCTSTVSVLSSIPLFENRDELKLSASRQNEKNVDLADLHLENQKMNKKIEYILNLLDLKSKSYCDCNIETTSAEYETCKKDETTIDTVMKFLNDEGTTTGSCQISNHEEGFLIIEEHFEMLADDGWQQINFSEEERI